MMSATGSAVPLRTPSYAIYEHKVDCRSYPHSDPITTADQQLAVQKRPG